jgi:5-methylcytosine-specific restriction endonuclease McrA
MRPRKYTDSQLIDAIATSTTFADTLRKIGLSPRGGNYKSVKRTIQKLNLDTSHFMGLSWSRGRKLPPKRPLQDYLNNQCEVRTSHLKQRLLREKIFPHECAKCHLTNWLDGLIPLELHHKDGNSLNNDLVNLELLCPNCHALTDNYRGKGINRLPKT